MNQQPPAAASLQATAARGGFVLGLAGAAESGIAFLRALLLARVLAPVDFGLMGMAFVVVQAGDAFSQTGFYQALVQKRGDVSDYLDTVFCVSALRGAALFALAWFIAPLGGAFFSTAAAVPIIRCVALSFLVQAVQNPALSILEREFAFARYVTPRIAGALVEGIFSVTVALFWPSVWALVWGWVAGRAALVVVSYAVKPYMPSLRWSREKLAEFRGFGKHIFRGVAVDYVASQADRALIGRLLGAEPLGLYTFAQRLASLPASGLFTVVIRVAFPVFSSIQDDVARRRTGFLRAIGLMTAIAAPIAAGLLAIAPDLVPVAFGAKWLAMLTPLRILCLAAPWMVLYHLLGMIIGGMGRPDSSANGTYVLLGVIAVTMYPSTLRWGISGTASSVTLACLATSVYLLVVAARLAQCRAMDVVRVLAAGLIASAAMAAALAAVRGFMSVPTSLPLVSVEVAAGMILYPALFVVGDRWLGSGLWVTLRETIRTLRPGGGT